MSIRLVRAIAATLLAIPLLGATVAPRGGPEAMISGIYELQEWHTDTAVLKAPQVYGRFVILDGAVMTVLRNSADPARQTTSAQIGHYTIDGAHFAYGYDNSSTFTEGPSGITAAHKRPWEGLRPFTIETTPESVHLKSDQGSEFTFTRAGLTYSQGGKPLRVYRRITGR